jgi:hypothetical protein
MRTPQLRASTLRTFPLQWVMNSVKAFRLPRDKAGDKFTYAGHWQSVVDAATSMYGRSVDALFGSAKRFWRVCAGGPRPTHPIHNQMVTSQQHDCITITAIVLLLFLSGLTRLNL